MGYRAANEQMGMAYRDVWTTAYVNDLPDSSFLYIAPGGTKTDGKTDGAHRYFPVKDANGKVDAAHLRNALARIPQASSLSADVRAACMKKAKAMATAHESVGGPAGTYEGTAGSGRAVEPPPGIETRSYEVTVELRAEGDGRTLVGRAVPYGQTAQVGGGTERFVHGAFAKQIAGGPDVFQRVKLYDSHQARMSGEQPIGKTASLAELADGLHGEWPLYNTTRANDALELVRSGEVTGLSIGFKALPGGTHRGADGAAERVGAHLDHIVLTHEPVYAGATVVTVRSRPLASYRTDLLRAQAILERLTVGL
jgi:HK97 family phage prohead protease